MGSQAEAIQKQGRKITEDKGNKRVVPKVYPEERQKSGRFQPRRCEGSPSRVCCFSRDKDI